MSEMALGASASPALFSGHNSENPCGAREMLDFHKRSRRLSRAFHIDGGRCQERNFASGAGLVRSCKADYTKSGHRLVDGLHSIENTDSCGSVFLIDEKNRRSTTRSFFDSFL